jgi:hypothetical protein
MAAPRDYPAHRLSTLFLRVPSVDWTAVRRGSKTEFRTLARPGKLILPLCPTPVVAYMVKRNGEHAAKLMVLISQEKQQLLQIAEDGDALAREGFSTYREFIDYFRRRQAHAYRMNQDVVVSRVRPYGALDDSEMGARLLRRLYGEYRNGEFSEHAHL